jgi:hypothetical protein
MLNAASVAELADAPGLGPGGHSPWGFDSSRSHEQDQKSNVKDQNGGIAALLRQFPSLLIFAF